MKINYSHWYQPLLSIHLSDVPKVHNGVIGFNNPIIAAMISISFILTAGTSENVTNLLLLVYVVSWYTLGTTCKSIRPSSHEMSLSNRARNYFAWSCEKLVPDENRTCDFQNQKSIHSKLCRIDHSHIARYNHSGWFSQIELTKIIKIRTMGFIWDFRLRLIGLEFETRIYL